MTVKITDEGREKAQELEHMAEFGQAIVDARNLADDLEQNEHTTVAAYELADRIKECLEIVGREEEEMTNFQLRER